MKQPSAERASGASLNESMPATSLFMYCRSGTIESCCSRPFYILWCGIGRAFAGLCKRTKRSDCKSAAFGLRGFESLIRYVNIMQAAVCKHCGKNIHKRNEVQGWLHAGGYKECRPTYAEPKE